MALFWKGAAGLFVVAVLVITVGRQEKDIALLLVMAACVMVVTAGLSLLEPVVDLLHRLEELGNLQSGVLSILLKITGIGLVTQTGGMILSDSGNTSLARGLQLLGTSVILYLSVPVFETLIDLIQHVLGEI